MNEYKAYTGIGSRDTPPDICMQMRDLASQYEKDGWILRSGHADGSDLAFESGVMNVHNKEIYIPHLRFNGSNSMLLPSAEAFVIAERYHPTWDKCSVMAKKLHARNVHQVLGQDLKSPSKFLVCYTVDGEISGGTGQALRIAISYGIPIKNLHENGKKDFTYVPE
jgi:hypothetical protein